jgi:hypothetical protein
VSQAPVERKAKVRRKPYSSELIAPHKVSPEGASSRHK